MDKSGLQLSYRILRIQFLLKAARSLELKVQRTGSPTPIAGVCMCVCVCVCVCVWYVCVYLYTGVQHFSVLLLMIHFITSS